MARLSVVAMLLLTRSARALMSAPIATRALHAARRNARLPLRCVAPPPGRPPSSRPMSANVEAVAAAAAAAPEWPRELDAEPIAPLEEVETRVHKVTDVAGAEAALAALRLMPPGTFHACDTEVSGLDLSKSPLGQGTVICFSVYSGPDADYGSGPGAALWVETNDEAVLRVFQPWLEDEGVLKVWHNYGFDRHVLYNHGIDVRGFGGDTMHMARLWDASRLAGYSLEALTDELVGRKKTPMKQLFGVPRLKRDGTPGKITDLPPVEQLQSDPMTRPKWIEYSAYDSQGTWLLHERLRAELEDMPWQEGRTLFDFYWQYWRPFGETLTDLERNGIKVDAASRLPTAELRARASRDELEFTFRRWAASHCADAWYMNPGSSTQVQTLLFGGAQHARSKEVLPLSRHFKLEREEFEDLRAAWECELDEGELIYALHEPSTARHASPQPEGDAQQEGAAADEPAAPRPSLDASTLAVDTAGGNALFGPYAAGAATDGVDAAGEGEAAVAAKPARRRAPPKPGKWVEYELRSMQLQHQKVTKGSGWPATDAAALRGLAGNPTDDPPVYGAAYDVFGGGAVGRQACEAIDALCQMGAIDTMLSNFILPLQENADSDSRVHCSLNLNTETGRLSSRAPNLQNQPALEKDQYRIRDAFTAEEGNMLVVADYGQLELRLLAHITRCQSMIDAFREGGCFHSRTAMGMFDHVRQAVESGECLLEWDYSKGKPPAPLLKDVFGSERRRAKTLNFSIAYGKTPHGLSKDWGVTVQEAKAMLEAWYSDRPEVLRWQQETIATAHRTGWTRTLMGRYRKLPGINGPSQGIRAHSERAAINTPIQGGAADIMTLAMLKLTRSPRLKELGYRMLLQIHDEVILEGPEENAAAAQAEVVACMEDPFDDNLPSLLVHLAVDSDKAFTWYEAK